MKTWISEKYLKFYSGFRHREMNAALGYWKKYGFLPAHHDLIYEIPREQVSDNINDLQYDD